MSSTAAPITSGGPVYTLRICVTCLLIAQPLAAQSLTPPPDARVRIDRHFERFSRRPGCEVGAASDGRTVLAAGYGGADLRFKKR